MLLGYARAATDGEALRLQRHALVAEGCGRILADRATSSAYSADFDALIAELGPGDTLVVCRLEILARSLDELVGLADALRARGVGLRSLAERIDTDAPDGALVYGVFAALARFARNVEPETERPTAVSARRPFPSQSGTVVDVVGARPRPRTRARPGDAASIAARKRIGVGA